MAMTDTGAPEQAPRKTPGWLSYAAAILLTPVGVVLSVIAFARGQFGPAVALLLTTAVTFAAYVVIGWPILDQHAAATAYTPAEMAKELTKTHAADGERFTGVTCTKRDPVTFRCKGNHRPNPDQRYSSYPQATPTEAKEWADEQTGPLALTVTVEPDGAWEANPV